MPKGVLTNSVNCVTILVNMTTKKLRERNANIKEYKRLHPKSSLRAMGRIFKLSHVMIYKILKRESNGNKE